MRMTSWLLPFLACFTLGTAATSEQQPEPLNITWEHATLAVSGVVVLTFFDGPLRALVQENTNGTLDDISDVAKNFKDAKVFYIAGGGAIAAGLAGRNGALTRTGVQILTSYGLSSAIMIASKWAFGRTRPWQTPYDAHEFDWLNGGADQSFPSGSAAVVFGLATTLSDAINRTPVSVLLYTAALANSWSRVYSNRHWLTDVVVGGLVGITSARIVNGRWRLFGFAPPTVSWNPGVGATVGFSTAGRRRTPAGKPRNN